MEKTVIQIALADDHHAVRQAFRSVLSQYDFLSILFEADNGKTMISELSVHLPDVVLLDIKMPELNGIEVLKIIHRQYPTVKVLILSAFLDETYVMECLKYGINGYLTKNMNIHEIVKAIETAAKNEVYLTNLLNNAYLKSYIVQYKKNTHSILPEFTQEEIRIIELLKHERSTEEISQIMHLSKRSIELKREKMKEKAQTKTVGGLLLYCLKRGLIE